MTAATRCKAEESGKHTWKTGQELGFDSRSLLYKVQCCTKCGMTKGPGKRPESICKGRVKVTTQTKE